MKKSFGYELMCLLSCFLILFTSCGSSIPQEVKPPPSSNLDAKPADNVRPQYFWQGAWWGTTGALPPEAIATIQSKSWILSGARLARQAALGVTDAPAFDFPAARQIWNEQAQMLTVLIPFVGDNSPYGVTVNIAPKFYAFTDHYYGIESASYGGFTAAEAKPDRLYLQGVSVAAVQQSNLVYSSVDITLSGTLGIARMMVMSKATKKMVNTFSTNGNVVTQNQMKTVFKSQISPQGFVVVPCALANESNPNNLPVCPPVWTPGKDYGVPPSGPVAETQPIPTTSAPTINCTALQNELRDMFRELESVRLEVALQGIALGASCILAIVGAASAPPPWNVLAVKVAAGGYCAAVAGIFFVIEARFQRQKAKYEAKLAEYVRVCS